MQKLIQRIETKLNDKKTTLPESVKLRKLVSKPSRSRSSKVRSRSRRRNVEGKPQKRKQRRRKPSLQHIEQSCKLQRKENDSYNYS